MKTESNPYKRMTSPSIQNFKALSFVDLLSYMFFLICCLTVLFLPNMRLRLTLEYLTIYIYIYIYIYI